MATHDITCANEECSEQGVTKTLDDEVYALAQQYETGVVCGKCGATMTQVPEP